jgi:hypothetical protein
MSKEVETLVVGLDDSNHAGISKGEIVAATFSLVKEDGIVRDFPNSRSKSGLEKWLSSESRDYRFDILNAEIYRHSNQNLVSCAPELIKKYLEDESLFPKELKVYLDGRLERGLRDYLRQQFFGFHGIERVIVDNFIKKRTNSQGRISKRPHCPAVVYYADILAHNLYKKSFEKLSKDSRLVSIK